MNFFHNKHGAFGFIAMIGFAFLLPVLVISDTNIQHLVKESHESSQQRNLQVAPAAVDTCFTVHFTTSSEEEEENNGSTSPAVKKKSGRGRKKGKKSKFFIVGYGEVSPDCQETGAKCDIEICGTRNKLDIVLTQTKDMWRFSITGDIGPLLYHDEHPTSNEKNIAGFPTNMGGSFDVFQSYQLVDVSDVARNKAHEWIANDSRTIANNSRTDERLALVNLYFATTGEAGWDRQNKWLTGEHHCDWWWGVQCNSDMYVIELYLYSNELTGPIPEAIGNLVNLQYLYLHGNELTGPIPETIGNLVNLQQLALYSNELTGPIPETIGNLLNLQNLYLYGNEFDLIPDWLTTFCERTTLNCWL